MKIVSASSWPKPGFRPPEANLPGGFNIPEIIPEARITIRFDTGETITTTISQMLGYKPNQKP